MDQRDARIFVLPRPEMDMPTLLCIKILEKVFVTKDTVTQLLQKFYQRDQKESEINKRLDKKMQISDINLTERFIDGVMD